MLTEGGMRSFDIVTVTEEAPDCFSYVLCPSDGNVLRFLPGQFLSFDVDVHQRVLRRAYSVSGRFGDNRFRVTVKKVENGEVSRHIIGYWAPGDRVQAQGPAGRFVLPEAYSSRQPFVFIAAGSGITPVFALLQALLERPDTTPVLLITQFSGTEAIIFRNALEALRETRAGRFRWISLLSRPREKGLMPTRLNNEMLEQLLAASGFGPATGALHYLCGPLPFMRMAAFTLRETGVPEENIRRELFDPPATAPQHFHLDASPHTVVLRRGKEQFTFTAAFPDSILDAAAKAGVYIPYSCRAGICSSCTLRCVSGKVTMRVNEVLTDADLEKGFVLTCVGYAMTDILLAADR